MVLIPILLLSSPTVSAAELDWYASFPGITGGSTAQGHTGWVEISALHHLWFREESHVTMPPERMTLILSKEVDVSTTQFWQRFRQQVQFSDVTLDGVAEIAGQLRVLQQIKLEDVRIESIETVGRFEEDTRIERIRLSYRRQFEFTSRCYDASGDSCGEHTFQYDWGADPPP
jgi:type VI protein secretion system component Hcp